MRDPSPAAIARGTPEAPGDDRPHHVVRPSDPAAAIKYTIPTD
jgi:hypothetical protein